MVEPFLRGSVLFGVLLLFVSACTDSGAFPPQGVLASGCESRSWRAASNDIVCPLAPGCGCSGGDICCVKAVSNKAESAVCSPLSACRDVVMECDGPEDCPSGQVCCAEGPGTQCMDSFDCFGSATYVCHQDEDCRLSFETCTPPQAGSYLDGVAAACR